MKVTITGTGEGGKLIGRDLDEVVDRIEPDMPIKARTTVGGWLKSITVELTKGTIG
jgi:hypothetical protein